MEALTIVFESIKKNYNELKLKDFIQNISLVFQYKEDPNVLIKSIERQLLSTIENINYKGKRLPRLQSVLES